jgi:phosphoglycolate phosphatase-like HAD superfamily hydrolase
VDVLTARNAGVPVAGVTYGFQPETLEEQPPDFKADRMEQVAEMVIAGRSPKDEVRS